MENVARSAGGVEVVAARLDVACDAVLRLSAWLCEDERRRAARFRFERHRRRYVVARGRLRELLAERLATTPRSIAFVYGVSGKPALAQPFARSGWRFSVSHCGGLALYAFSRRGELGVDLEAVRPLPEADAIAARCFSPREHAAYRGLAPRERLPGFFACWTRKEAFVKALGGGLSLALRELDLSDPPPGWRLERFSPSAGFVAALAHR